MQLFRLLYPTADRLKKYILSVCPSVCFRLYRQGNSQVSDDDLDFQPHIRLQSFVPIPCESKNPPCGFLNFFPKRLGIFNQFFTHLLYDPFYARLQIFIQISPTLTKLCHTERDHPANFHISLEL